MDIWDGKERRKTDTGRRETDTCAEHCFYVNEWKELKREHKEDEKQHDRELEEIEKKIDSKSPLVLVIALIATVALCTILSMGYTFKTSAAIQTDMAQVFAGIQKEFTERLVDQNQTVVQQLMKIGTDLEVAKTRQSDIKNLLQTHIEKFEKGEKITMKKTIAIIGVLFFMAFSTVAYSATEWHTANQTTIGWTQDPGNINPAEIKYNIYLANAITDPAKSNPVKVGSVSAKEYTVTLNTEGRFFVGVAAFRTVDGVDLESNIAWSDAAVPAFGVQFFEVPKMPGGLILK